MNLIRTMLVAGLVGMLPATAAASTPLRDGSHDFDFNFGVWHTHITRVLHPLTASTASATLEGTVTVRKIWGGKASIEEIEADGAAGHWEGMSVFLYAPATHRWSQTYIGAADGDYEPGEVGSFRNGRGEFWSTDTLGGKAILVRGLWSSITPTSHEYREMYSGDRGAHWQTVFDAHLTRLAASAPEDGAPVSSTGAHRDFDFDFGTWATHSRRLRRPLARSHDWVALDGTTVVHKIWGGRANYAEVTMHGSGAPPQIFALRWYSPSTNTWDLDFANARTGTLGAPASGTFHHGRIDFTDRERYDGKRVVVRFSVWQSGAGRAHSEQAFSPNGTAWETNWITDYVRCVSPKQNG